MTDRPKAEVRIKNYERREPRAKGAKVLANFRSAAVGRRNAMRLTPRGIFAPSALAVATTRETRRRRAAAVFDFDGEDVSTATILAFAG
jgi:hypothetical protein